MDEINDKLDEALTGSFLNIYGAFQVAIQILAPYGYVVPASYLTGIQGTYVHQLGDDLFFYFEWSDCPETGNYLVFCNLVGQDDLDELFEEEDEFDDLD